jgi:putative acetyltransferase
MNTHVTTPNSVTIRAAEPGDYQAVQQIYAQRGAYFGTMQLPYPSAAMWQERLAAVNSHRHMLVACIDDLPIGNIGLTVSERARTRHSGSIGMGVHDDYAGRGIGQMLMDAALDLADNWWNLRRVELTVYADNDRAIRLYKRSGFEVEGTLREYVFRDGQYVDALTMARFHPNR